MTDSRELTADQWAALTTKTRHTLNLAYDLMNQLPGAEHPEWHELHDLAKILDAAVCTAARYRDRARDRADLEAQTAPVPYLPARLTPAEWEAETAAELRQARSELSAAPPAPLAAEGVYRLRPFETVRPFEDARERENVWGDLP